SVTGGRSSPPMLPRAPSGVDTSTLTTPRREAAEGVHPPAAIQLPRIHPHMLRHTYVTTMLDAGVPLRDVQIAARHADPRTTMRYDRARKNPDRTPTTYLPPTWP